VIEVDAAARRLTLSMKDPEGGPWNRVGGDFEVGGVYTGRITRVLDYGAFVALAPGLEGLVHISNMAARRVQNPRDLFNPGDAVEVRLLSADVEAKRLELGIKQAQDSSWTPPTTEVEVAAPRADRKAPATLGKLGDLFAGIKIQVKEPAANPGRRGPSSNPRK
jgi:ribosomal protein S1